MMLTRLQKEKVDEICWYFQNNQNYRDNQHNGKQVKVDFKAPTGSGKTLMASAVISKMINDNQGENFIFIIATISSSGLPEQFERKINEYKADLDYSNFDVEYIESPSASKSAKRSDNDAKIKLVRNKVYIFGKATFGKGRIYTEQKVIEDFINEAKQQGYKIVYIRDEAHHGDKEKRDEVSKNFEALMHDNADYILRMTATFDKKDSSINRVELTERELNDRMKNENKWLIKDKLQIVNDEEYTDENLLDKSIETFKQVQGEYKKLEEKGVFIRPAMLIQVDDESKTNAERQETFERNLKMIKTKLSNAGLSWVQYFGNDNKESSNIDNDNFTLEKITRNNDTTDAIIFKIGPATGWDIPRACMLVQLRNVCSTALSIQTIGRIKRNPCPNLEKNKTTMKYYIHTNEKKAGSNFNIYEYKVKKEFENEPMLVIRLKNKAKDGFAPDRKIIDEEVKNLLENEKNAILQQKSELFKYGYYKNTKDRVEIRDNITLLKVLKAKLNNLSAGEKLFIDSIKARNNCEIKYESLLLVLLTNYLNDIRKIYSKSLPQKVEYEFKEEVVKPDVYTQICDENKDKDEKEIDNKYMFEIKKNGQKELEQILDSPNEAIVWKKLKGIFMNDNKKIKLWCKNQRTGNVYGEYYDEFQQEHRSYFDFVIKFNNGNYLYLEVKGSDDKDIDRSKTEMLKRAYEEYFKGNVLYAKNLVICVVEVEEKNIKKISPFYNQKQFDDKLEKLGLETVVRRLM
ncbi:MAG: DEAD/DEAH box helicase family protein [Rickettsiales bacterium]|nr:DEAD/DEAH box helicase family protein [Rickettsiales bacterium]